MIKSSVHTGIFGSTGVLGTTGTSGSIGVPGLIGLSSVGGVTGTSFSRTLNSNTCVGSPVSGSLTLSNFWSFNKSLFSTIYPRFSKSAILSVTEPVGIAASVEPLLIYTVSFPNGVLTCFSPSPSTLTTFTTAFCGSATYVIGVSLPGVSGISGTLYPFLGSFGSTGFNGTSGFVLGFTGCVGSVGIPGVYPGSYGITGNSGVFGFSGVPPSGFSGCGFGVSPGFSGVFG